MIRLEFCIYTPIYGNTSDMDYIHASIRKFMQPSDTDYRVMQKLYRRMRIIELCKHKCFEIEN